MSQNRIAEPVQVRIAVVGATGIQASATSNTCSGQPKATTVLIPLLITPLPSVQVGDPILTGKQ